MAKIRVLADFHHGYLLESLYMLFEDRLGWELYRPIGTEWYTEGYWLVFDAMDTAEQYLGLHHGEALKAKQDANPLGDDPWKNAGLEQVDDGLYEVPSLEFAPRRYRAVTLACAKEMKFDFVLSSTPDHFPRTERFRQEFQPQAKHIWQCGNPWSCPPGARNILNSTTSPMPPWVNEVRYHQEFDSKTRFVPPKITSLGTWPSVLIKTVANLLHYGDLKRFREVKELMPEFRFLAHGAGNADKSIPEHVFAHTLRTEIGFLWHAKRDDGYGYNLHTAAACGKPIICNASALRNQKAGPLLTAYGCLNLDVESNDGIARGIREIAARYPVISERIRKRFEEVCNFDAEFPAIQKFLERCV